MATNHKVEIHLRDLMASSKNNAELVIVLCDMGLQALAELDAAREELAQARNRIEFLENGAAPVDAAQPKPDAACEGYAEAATRKILNLGRELGEAREELAKLKAAQPVAEPTAVDLVAWIQAQREFSSNAFGPGARWKGCVAHIRKELAEIEADPTDLMEWVDVAILAFDGAWRAGHEPRAIAEAMRAKLAKNQSREWPDWRTKREDEPIEHVKAAHPEPAPVVGGVTEALLDRLDNIFAKHGLSRGMEKPIDEWMKAARAARRKQKRVDVEALRKIARFQLAWRSVECGNDILRAIGDEPAEAPVAEPAAPVQEQEGPFTVEGVTILENGEIPFTNRACMLRWASLLNAGLEAEKLRARVAELEPILTEICKLFGWTDMSALHASMHVTNAINNLRADLATEKARADAAEAKLAERERQEKPSTEMPADLEETELDAWKRFSSQREERAKDAEAKLAALGENPIPRALVLTWREKYEGLECHQIVADFNEILAGREPGVAS